MPPLSRNEASNLAMEYLQENRELRSRLVTNGNINISQVVSKIVDDVIEIYPDLSIEDIVRAHVEPEEFNQDFNSWHIPFLNNHDNTTITNGAITANSVSAPQINIDDDFEEFHNDWYNTYVASDDVSEPEEEIEPYMVTTTTPRPLRLNLHNIGSLEATLPEFSVHSNARRDTPIPTAMAEFYEYAPTQSKRRRSEKDMMMDIVRGENFPKPNFIDWSDRRKLNSITNDWYRNAEYKDLWIFQRREREGFNRRNIGQFGIDDVMARINKRKNKHHLDTDSSTFYDWKLGGTDWILRLELYKEGQHTFLISRYIYVPENVEIMYTVRYWAGQSFKQLVTIVSEYNNEGLFERCVGSISDSYDHEEDYEEDYYDDDDD